MRKNHIFVLLIILLLPMSGCVDGTVGNAEGEGASTNLINYYNNSTVINNYDYQYLVFDERIQNGSWNNSSNFGNQNEYVLLGEFNTSANHLFSMIYSSSTCESSSGWNSGQVCGIMIFSTCGDVYYTWQVLSTSLSETSTQMIKGTVDSNCSHSIYTTNPISYFGNQGIFRVHFEFAFKIIDVTEYN